MPLTDFVSAVSAQNINASTTTNRYILGVTGEARLPFGLGVEVDVLYRHFRYSSSSGISLVIWTWDLVIRGLLALPLRRFFSPLPVADPPRKTGDSLHHAMPAKCLP